MHIWITAIATSLFVGLTSSFGVDLASAMIMFALSICVILLAARERDQKLLFILCAALAIRGALVLINIYIMPLPDSGQDARKFERLAWEAATAWKEGYSWSLPTPSYRFSEIVAFIYYVFGRLPLAAHLLNVFFGMVAIYYTYKSSFILLGSQSIARAAALIMALYPTAALYSSVLLREVPIAAALSISLYSILQWARSGKVRYVFASLVALASGTMLHDGAFVAIIGYILLLLLYSPRMQRWRFSLARIIIVGMLLIAIIPTASTYLPAKLRDATSIQSSEDLAELLESRTGPSLGRTAYLSGLQPSNSIDIAWQTPLRMAYFMFAPMPWMISSPQDLIGVADAIGITVLWFCIFRQYRRTKDRDIKALYFSILASLIALWIVFSWGSNNYGTSIRHRQKMLFLIIPLAAPYFSYVFPKVLRALASPPRFVIRQRIAMSGKVNIPKFAVRRKRSLG